MTNVGAVILELRESLDLPQTAFAEAVGLTSDMISKIERGVRQPSYDTLRRIEERFGYEFTIEARRTAARQLKG